MRFRSLLFLAICIIFGIGIYQVKNLVNERERKLAQIEKTISGVKQNIHMLEAEWSVLNDPERLKKMADKHLELQPAKASRIVSFAAVPDKIPQEQESESVVDGAGVASNETYERLPDGFINSSVSSASEGH